ncbi:hypothetical protein SteCoe_14589 [Stentor coeruleus]|uniref:Uncharacterized protein n=1 Tax=Stentor coeruleus TaxID=5963 RepID=A0A1R2C5M1_9CILI|nr:hypothetical protein SteCoe_14589 [Stentor coeruleus]
MGKDTKKKLVRDHHKVISKEKKGDKSAESTPKKDKKKDKTKKDKKETKEKKEKNEKNVKAEPVESKNNDQKSKKPKKDVNDDEDLVQEIPKKPGQKHPEPSLDDPTRAFYETLYEQNPESAMAQKYCLEYGLLPEDTAVAVLAKLKNKR